MCWKGRPVIKSVTQLREVLLILGDITSKKMLLKPEQSVAHRRQRKGILGNLAAQ